LKAAIETTINREITWKGTHYSLDELKANLQKVKMQKNEKLSPEGSKFSAYSRSQNNQPFKLQDNSL
jgi:hypothetical protein